MKFACSPVISRVVKGLDSLFDNLFHCATLSGDNLPIGHLPSDALFKKQFV